MRFEGWSAAQQYAQLESKKIEGILYLIKRDTGGIHYLVVNDESKIHETDRLLDKFKRGEIVK